jgi:hypothetical protein
MNTTKQKITIYTQAQKYDFQNGFDVTHSTYKSKTSSDMVVVDLCESEVEINMPVIDEKVLTQAHVQQLQEQIAQEKQDSFQKVKRLEDKVKMLLCIEGGQ